MFGKKSQKQEKESRGAKLRRGATNVLKHPKVRSEADRLARDPRVQRKVFEWAKRAAQRFRRR